MNKKIQKTLTNKNKYDIIKTELTNSMIPTKRGGNNMYDQKEEYKQKISLYIDIDNTIITTAETFIEKYCTEKGIKKDFYNLKDWNFRSIDRKIDSKEFLKYIETKEFFNEVQFYDDFLRFYVRNGDNFNFNFVTIGTKKNLELKKDFIFKSLPTIKNVKYIGLENNNKNIIDMSNGIQIDDKYDNLNTSAKIKILQKNYIETDYNQVKKEFRDDLYIMQDWKQIGETLEFFNNNRDIWNQKI